LGVRSKGLRKVEETKGGQRGGREDHCDGKKTQLIEMLKRGTSPRSSPRLKILERLGTARTRRRGGGQEGLFAPDVQTEYFACLGPKGIG